MHHKTYNHVSWIHKSMLYTHGILRMVTNDLLFSNMETWWNTINVSVILLTIDMTHQLCFALTWVCRDFLHEYDLLHWSQSYTCCVEVCFLMWSARPPDDTNVLGQFIQMNLSLTVACVVFMCDLRDDGSVNALSHRWQQYGFSPVCVLMCVVRLPDRAKDFVHSWHLNGFSPVCSLMCDVRLPDWLNDFAHRLQVYGFSPECDNMWIFSSRELKKVFAQISHL